MKVLVAVAFYPDDMGNKRLFYTHVRNVYYQNAGINVTVLNFSTDHDYEVDGIKVISLKTYKEKNEKYTLLICHAANIRNHYRFLSDYNDKFANIMFFFHGHEIMHVSRYYPVPYPYKKHGYVLKKYFQNFYDTFKLYMWKKFFVRNSKKIKLIFVSKWLSNVFDQELRLTHHELDSRKMIIHNSVGKPFELESYQDTSPKKYDFITIRNYLDDSKYAVDIVVRDAQQHPEYKFCLIGRGEYFKHYLIPNNMTLIQSELSHSDILRYLDQSRCGLMPTREDTQGVMTCEMATYGIPVITSDISICREIFDHFDNVILTSNDKSDLKSEYEKLIKGVPYQKNLKYSYANTVKKEINLIKELI